ncbi:MAG: outer membrane protein assembly factor BamE [Steroidobacteraceae bacterium]
MKQIMRAWPLSLTTVLLAVVLTSSGCVYRMTLQQGNFLDPKAVSQLQVGMTKVQVRYLLGTPMVPDAFDSDRWDYVHYLKVGRWKKPQRQRLTVYFVEEKVSRIDNDGVASAAADSVPASTSDTPAEQPSSQ